MVILKEFFTYAKKSCLLSLFIVLCVIASIVLFNSSSLIIHEAELDFDKYKEIYTDGHYMGLGDKLYDEVEKSFLSRNDHIDVLISINDWLHENDLFEYFEGKIENIAYSDSYTPKTSEGYFAESMKTYWISPDEIQHFDLTVNDGRMLSEEDFFHTAGMAMSPGAESEDEIHILAGNSLKSKYSVGDTIDMYHVLFAGKARIVGFLNKSANVVDQNGNVFCVDDNLVFPYFNTFTGNETEIYMRILYLQKNNGKIYSKYSVDDTQDMINEYTSSLGIPGSYFVCASNHQWQPVFSKNLDDVVSGLKSLAVGISFFSALALGLYLFIKIRKSLRYYGILLLNGFTAMQIKMMIFAEVFAVMASSFTIGLIVSYVLKDSYYREYDINLFTGVIPMLLIGLTDALVAFIAVTRYDVSTSISEEN